MAVAIFDCCIRSRQLSIRSMKAGVSGYLSAHSALILVSAFASGSLCVCLISKASMVQFLVTVAVNLNFVGSYISWIFLSVSVAGPGERMRYQRAQAPGLRTVE